MWEIGSIKMAEQLHAKKGLSEVKPQFRKHIAGLHGWHHGRTIINPKSDYCHILLKCGIRATRRRWKYCIINVLKKLWKARGDDSVPFGGKEELYSCKWSPKRCFYRRYWDTQPLLRWHARGNNYPTTVHEFVYCLFKGSASHLALDQ